MAPGPVENLEFINATIDSATLSFDKPSENPQCVKEYVVTYRDLNASFTEDKMEKSSSPEPFGEFYSIVLGLKPCTTYEFLVMPVSPKGLQGPTTAVTGDTDIAIPGQVAVLTAKPLSTTSIEVYWVEAEVRL